MNDLVSIVITNYNGSKYIKPCLQSVYSSSYHQIEVIVIDDGSTDSSVKTLQKLKYPITLIQNSCNQGACFSRNKGVLQASGKYIVFLDVDTQIDPQSINIMIDYLENHGQVGAVQGCLLNPDKKTIETAGIYLSPLGYPYEIKENSIHDILGGRTACLTLRREVFDKCGGFDQDYVIYGEDIDICWRIWRAGNKVQFLPSATIIHHQKSSLTKDTKHRIFYEGTKNNLRNILKNLDTRYLSFVLPVFIVSSFLLCLKQIISGNISFGGDIVKAFAWNIKHLNVTLKLRTRSHKLSYGTIFGPINTKELIAKSISWYFKV